MAASQFRRLGGLFPQRGQQTPARLSHQPSLSLITHLVIAGRHLPDRTGLVARRPVVATVSFKLWFNLQLGEMSQFSAGSAESFNIDIKIEYTSIFMIPQNCVLHRNICLSIMSTTLKVNWYLFSNSSKEIDFNSPMVHFCSVKLV